MRAVIGIDYGTQAARAVLVDAENGQVLCSHTVRYPHGVIDDGLASAEDYESALFELLEKVTPAEYKQDIVGICVDATSFTFVPVNADGVVLSMLPALADHHHAQIKLWKYHAAQPQADEALTLARILKEPFLNRTGGTISSEWALPKLLEIRDKAPEIYNQIDIAFDLCDFLTYRLTGKLTRSVGSLSYKGLWAKDLGFPGDDFLNGLRSGFAAQYRYLLRGTVLRPGDRAGLLKPELCRSLGLSPKTAVAVGTLDGHTALAALGALQEGDAALAVGTSNVLTIQTKKLCEVEGICGIAMDGLTAGLYGIDSGQNCTGDMLEWYINHALPEHILKEAEKRHLSPHQVLSEQAKCPWNNSVIITDWWNGSRNAPCDLSLPGIISGLSLNTRPQEIYLALLQSIACGTREIIEQCASYGTPVKRLFLTGGITQKNSLLMQEYANILHCPVYVGQIQEGPALGAAIFASVAADIYTSPLDAYKHMGVHHFTCYEPDTEHSDAYEKLYQKNHTLRMLGVHMYSKSLT